ncbi:hypothetical protein ES702_07240 [subsurface metagenome]
MNLSARESILALLTLLRWPMLTQKERVMRRCFTLLLLNFQDGEVICDLGT